MNSEPQEFAKLKLTEKDGASYEFKAWFRPDHLAIAANAMINQDVTCMEFLAGMITFTIISDDGSTTRSQTAQVVEKS